jgi:hypothetical protein
VLFERGGKHLIPLTGSHLCEHNLNSIYKLFRINKLYYLSFDSCLLSVRFLA